MGLDSLGSNNNISITSTPSAGVTNNGQTSGGNNSTNINFIDEKKQRLLNKLNLTPEQYDAICSKNPEFPTLSDIEQETIVNNFKNSLTVASDIAEEVEEQHTTLSFDRDSYIQLIKPEQKIDACYLEFTKNLFIYGSTKLNIPAHSAEEWNALSPEAKQAEVDKIKQYIETHDELGLQDKFAAITDDRKASLIDSTMTIIQAANSKDGVGTSCIDLLLTKTPDERLDIKYEYLSGLKEEGVQLTADEEKTITYRNFLADAIISEVNKRNVAAGREEFMGTLDSSADISEYLRLYNLNEHELVFNALKDKTDRTPQQEKIFQELSKVYGTPAGMQLVKEDKIANLVKLQAEFAELQSKAQTQELVGEDLQRFNVLQETLNTQQSKELLGMAQYLPKPETDYEKSIQADIEELNGQNQEFLGATSLNSIKFIESKTKGMTPEERKNYILNFIKFNNSGNKVALFNKYRKEFPEFLDNPIFTTVEGVFTAEYNLDEAQTVADNIIAASKSNNLLISSGAVAAQETANSILASDRCSGFEFDGHKRINSYCASNMHYNSPEEATACLNGATDVNITITNAAIQKEAQDSVTNSKSATDDVHIHTVRRAGDFHKDNQIGVLDGATSKSSKATAYAAENDILKTLDPDNQSDAYSLIQNRINEQYKGDDVDKYSSALAGQIKNCDPNAQSEMMSKVFASGNQKAIETAIASIPEFKSPDVQQIVLKQAVMELVDKEAFADILAKLGGTLTSEQIAHLSPSERREYFTKLFDKANFSDQVAMLKNILHGNSGIKSKVTVYNLIGKFYPNLFEELVKDSGVAEKVYNMQGLDPKLKNKTVEVIVNSFDSRMKALAQELHLTNDDDDYQQTANTVNYSSVPKDFNNETYDLFKKHGNLFA